MYICVHKHTHTLPAEAPPPWPAGTQPAGASYNLSDNNIKLVQSTSCHVVYVYVEFTSPKDTIIFRPLRLVALPLELPRLRGRRVDVDAARGAALLLLNILRLYII